LSIVGIRQVFAACILLAFIAAETRACPGFPIENLNTVQANQSGLAFSPDGSQAFWAAWNGVWGSDPVTPRTIFESSCKRGAWSPATIMPFSGTHNDDDPFVSADGQWLYFVSDRPASISTVAGDLNIWRYRLKQPHRLEVLDINSDHAEYSPVLTSSGNLYFASERPGGFGQGDLYRAAPTADGFLEPILLGPAVNSANGEWNLWVSPDETELLLEASSRPTNVSASGDIYYSWLTPSGWSLARPVTELNSAGSDLLPRVHPDMQTLYFTRAPSGGHARITSTNWSILRAKLRALQ
jgi:hypothetical protein